MKGIILGTVTAGLLSVGTLVLGQSPAASGEVIPFARPGSNPTQTRSEVLAKHGMIATSQPLATQAGLAVLQAGGNAADAAITANAVLGVVEPMNCGIGGDLLLLYWDAKSKKLHGLNASGRAPQGSTLEYFDKLGLKEIPSSGPLAWSVPGCVDGWEELRAKFGSRSLKQLLAPAVKYAEEGFPVSEIVAGGWPSPELAKDPGSAAVWLNEGRTPQVGELFHNPRLATALKLIGEQGREAFYKGEIAAAIVACSQAQGGTLALSDLAAHHSDWVEPISTNYRGHDVYELPPNSQGLAVLQMLNILEAYDLRTMGPNSPDYLHLFLEAKKLAYADRAKFYADPKFAQVPSEQLLSKDYASKRRKLIDPNQAAEVVSPGDPVVMKTGDTIYMCVVDDEGNCCSLIQSLFHGFGSKVTVPEFGIAMQNRGCLFNLDPQHANRLEPGKRPFHTIIPSMVLKDGTPMFCFGVMGGDMQPQGQVQVLINVIDFDMNVQLAGEAARVRHDGSPTPTGQLGDEKGGHVIAEPGIPEATRKALQARGHRVSPGSGVGGYQGILIDPLGVRHGGTDPRKDGAAAGY